MTKRVKIQKQIATASLTTESLSVRIDNINGIHTHVRNGEKFTGKQSDCTLCATGSEFEKALGRLGA